MEGISPQHRAAVNYTVQHLGTTATSVGYNDMAIMIAFGESELGTSTINAPMISVYLKRHPAVPVDSRMEPESVQAHLDVLKDAGLLDEQETPRNYRMRGDTSEILVADVGRLKSPHIDEFLYHGFRVHCSWNLASQPRR